VHASISSIGLLGHEIIASTAVEDILITLPNQSVIPSSAAKHVVAGAANQHVIAIAPVLGEQDRRTQSRNARVRRHLRR
jgi:hypothetical protein